ncbi:MAG: glycosyltransferase 87 family protein, partial [Propionibacteriaceae bacterium]|nr:glycosyltransferase 87 family protein [Propionibacteriaceae bacterium]
MPLLTRSEEPSAASPAGSGDTPAEDTANWRDLPGAVAEATGAGARGLTQFFGPFADLTRRFGGRRGTHAEDLTAPTETKPARLLMVGRFSLYALVVFGSATLAWIIGMLRQGRCLQSSPSDSINSFGWMCYTDITVLYQARGQAAGEVLYRDIAWEYPVLSGYFSEFAARLTGLFGQTPSPSLTSEQQLSNTNLYFAITTILLFICFLVVVTVQKQWLANRPWAVLAVAASPAIMTAALINWDLFAIALTSLALLSVTRRQPILAGLWFGLAIAAKFYPVVILGGLLALALRPIVRAWFKAPDRPAPPGSNAQAESDQDATEADSANSAASLMKARYRPLLDYGKLVATALGAWVLVNLPVMMMNFDQWKFFYSFNQDRGPDLGSPWYALNLTGFPTPNAQAWALGLMIIGYLAIALIIVAAPVSPRLGQVAFLCVALMVSLNTVYSPQYVLWTL